jgi:hypothetical protein
MGRLQAVLAATLGDVWRSWSMLAVWPYPAVVYGKPGVRFSWDDYRCFTRLLKPGDFLLSRSAPYFFSNRGIPGAFKHLAVYTGAVEGRLSLEGEEPEIIKAHSLGVERVPLAVPPPGVYERTVTHAISEGVLCQDLGSVLFKEDYVCAVRPWKTADQQKLIVENALKQVGKQYNFDFKPVGHKRLYCTELGKFCAERAGLELPGETLVVTSALGIVLPIRRFKTPAPLADNIAVKYPMVCCSESCIKDKLWLWSEHRDELRTALMDSVTCEDMRRA